MVPVARIGLNLERRMKVFNRDAFLPVTITIGADGGF